MEGSKLLDLVRSLSKDEFKVLGTRIEKSSNQYKLFDYLKKKYPDFSGKKIQKEIVYKKIFPKDKVFNAKKMRTVMSNLSTSIEEFLLHIKLEEKEVEKEFLMLDIYSERKLGKLFMHKVSQLQKKWDKNPHSGLEYYHNQFRLFKLCHTHDFSKISKKGSVSLMDLIEKMDNYYFASKLYYGACLFQSYGVIKEEEQEDANVLLEEIYNLRSLSHLQGNTHIEILGEFYDAYSNGNYNDYTSIKSLFFKHINQFDLFEQHDIFLFLQNYCYKNYQQGKVESLKELFELNKFAVEQGFLHQNNFIADDVFRNIVNLGCAFGDLDWVDQFIESHESYLEEEKRADMVALCKAILIFHQGAFQEALDKVLLVKYQDSLYGLLVRCLQLKCYIELGETDLFFSLINSATVWEHRDQSLSKEAKEAFRNFIQFCKKLYDLIHTPIKDLKKVEEFSVKIQEVSLIYHKTWLLKKIAELLSMK